MLAFLSDVDDTPIVETNYHLRDFDQDNVVRIPVQRYQLYYYRLRNLIKCHSICRGCFLRLFGHNLALFYVVCLDDK